MACKRSGVRFPSAPPKYSIEKARPERAFSFLATPSADEPGSHDEAFPRNCDSDSAARTARTAIPKLADA